jgi:redox-sensitive bicupin YhaK (pirin superfamily)
VVITTVTPLFFDVRLEPFATFCQAVAPTHSGFLYVIDGSIQVGDPGTVLEGNFLGVMGPGERISISAGDHSARFLLVAGREIGEPVARYGPFVMNTREEILQAIHDFQNRPSSG